MAHQPPETFRLQGWDPLLLISQIISLQSLHYLTLSLIAPALLSLLASGPDLDREGGPANVAMLMDWRLLAGHSTVPNVVDLEWVSAVFVQNAGKRSWALAVAWVAASAIDVFYLFHLVRKPTHILDFSLTLLFVHLLLTTYYASHLPTSLFFWATLLLSSIGQIIWAEQLCIRRDMQQGLGVVPLYKPVDSREEDVMMRPPGRGRPRLTRTASLPVTPHQQQDEAFEMMDATTRHSDDVQRHSHDEQRPPC